MASAVTADAVESEQWLEHEAAWSQIQSLSATVN